jgi:hypothetical protein
MPFNPCLSAELPGRRSATIRGAASRRPNGVAPWPRLPHGIWLLVTLFALSACPSPRLSPVRGGEPHVLTEIRLSPSATLDSVVSVLRRTPLRLDIEEINGGTIRTSFREYVGSERGVWIWKRQWQERSRFVIEVEGAWGRETESVIRVTVDSEERPNGNYPWENCNCEAGVQRRTELMSVLIPVLRARSR